MDEIKRLKKKLEEFGIWEYAGYEIPKSEADIVIKLLDKAIPKECKVIVVDSERADGTPCDTEISMCPGCNAKYRFSIPKYCGECGQRLKEIKDLDDKDLEKEPCEDCVSRKDIYFKLTNGAYPNETIEQFIDRLVKELKALPPVTPTQRWIPVSERLPEKEGDYLLWGKACEDEEEYPFIGSYDSGCEQFGIWQEQFDRTTLGCLGSEFFEYASVVAWMPLPKPYKAEMESGE